MLRSAAKETPVVSNATMKDQEKVKNQSNASQTPAKGASTSDPGYEKRLEAAKAQSVAQLLFKCARLLNDQGIALFRQRANQPKLRPAHATLFPHIDLGGTRLTVLAQRIGISKQAVGQLVAELEAMGSLERIPDPSDGRAKLIRFSEAGKMGLFQGLAVLAELEADLRGKIGNRHMDRLHEALTALLPVLEQGGTD